MGVSVCGCVIFVLLCYQRNVSNICAGTGRSGWRKLAHVSCIEWFNSEPTPIQTRAIDRKQKSNAQRKMQSGFYCHGMLQLFRHRFHTCDSPVGGSYALSVDAGKGIIFPAPGKRAGRKFNPGLPSTTLGWFVLFHITEPFVCGGMHVCCAEHLPKVCMMNQNARYEWRYFRFCLYGFIFVSVCLYVCVCTARLSLSCSQDT